MIAPANRSDSEEFNRSLDDPDARLMLRLRDGDHGALEELHQRYHGRLVGLITKMMGNSSLSEDLAQQVFLQVFRGRSRYTPTARFSTWLFTITRNVVSNARRGMARRREVPVRSWHYLAAQSGEPVNLSPELEPIDVLMKSELQNCVWDAVEQLGDLQQQAVRLVCLSGFRYRAAAEQMQVTEDSVRQLVYRGKGKLRGMLAHRRGTDAE